jgi:hypothetical protein
MHGIAGQAQLDDGQARTVACGAGCRSTLRERIQVSRPKRHVPVLGFTVARAPPAEGASLSRARGADEHFRRCRNDGISVDGCSYSRRCPGGARQAVTASPILTPRHVR